ncbi:retrovirus-related Pol polyprotein from transposon 412 [Trichonephila clavipes]|nr:retrovirus-related Pol polyprotein from transposon 412 [Trichonephila clavipes]
MKKRCSSECKEHYLAIREELISPEMLADKLEAFENIRSYLPNIPRRLVKASETLNDGRQILWLWETRSNKSRCPTCNLNTSQRTHVATNHINAYTAQTRSPRLTLIDITFCGIKGRVCADTGSSHSIAGESMFQIFKDKGLLFQETTLAMSLADGQQTFQNPNVTNICWYFWDNPTHKYLFCEELDSPSIVEKMSSNTCQLREGEGGEATNILENHIYTGNSPPTFVPQYRMSPVKNCPDCIKYKASNQKPSGLLQTPVPAQRFETLAFDLFGSLPKSKDGKRWILIIEDCTTKWVELFAVPNATAKECAITLIEEVLLRYDKHDCWSHKLPFIRFALNTAKCETTGQTAAFLNFGRELRTPSEVVNDIRVVIQNDNFVPEITPYLKKFAKFSTQIREAVEVQQDSRKFYADKKKKAAPVYQPGEHVFVASHPLSNAAQGRSAKLMPRRDGPYVILTQRSPSSYEIASLHNLGVLLGVYHTSALTPCNNDKVKPLIPLRKRVRPPKVPQTPGSSFRHRRNQRGRM